MTGYSKYSNTAEKHFSLLAVNVPLIVHTYIAIDIKPYLNITSVRIIAYAQPNAA